MKKLVALVILVALSSFPVFADNHAQSAMAPVEVWTCNLNAGKTIEDVRTVSQMVSKVSAKEASSPCQNGCIQSSNKSIRCEGSFCNRPCINMYKSSDALMKVPS